MLVGWEEKPGPQVSQRSESYPSATSQILRSLSLNTLCMCSPTIKPPSWTACRELISLSWTRHSKYFLWAEEPSQLPSKMKPQDCRGSWKTFLRGWECCFQISNFFLLFFIDAIKHLIGYPAAQAAVLLSGSWLWYGVIHLEWMCACDSR